MIRNKYNGYGFDGSRLYHDPISLSIAAAKAGAASSAAAAGTAAATTAATTAAGTAAAQTAALEAAKQAAIQTGMKQAGVEAAKQAGIEATKQAGVEAAKQAGAEASKQGIMQGTKEAAQNQTIEAFKQAQINPNRGVEVGKFAGEVAPGSLPPADMGISSSAYGPASTPFPSYGAMPPAAPVTPAAPLNPAGLPPVDQSQMMAFKSNVPSAQGPVPEFISPDVALPGKPPLVGEGAFVKGAKAAPDPGTFARAGSNAAEQGIAQMNTAPTSELMLKPTFETQFPLAPKNALAQGFETGLQYAKDNPISSGLGLMTVGQYMNQPKQPEKKQYRNTVDMSDFQPTIASVEPFKPSYEYQKYAVGGPVETMSAMNAIGGNMQYPQAGLQTALYSNPMVQRPESVNVISPGEGPAVGAYSGEQKFASGGLSEAQRREYGLRTRGERASRNLSKTYEEMEAEREKEAMKLLGERSDPGIIPRSRTQQLSSPFSAAETEYARLAKKNKVPVVPMAKTSLGDIDTYMDIPIEAAGGGIMHGLGGYSDGGRLLRGPGDGVSDSIPAVIGKRQPARLADGEFVIPARIVSELGNGSTEAGARKLYAMMERIQSTRKKSIGKKKVAVNSKADKHLPA
jgi:hypothetical protein